MMSELQQKVVLAVVVGGVLGWFLTAFVFYPPHSGWAEHLEMGNVADWLVAVATGAAAYIALWIALRDGRRIAQEQNARARLAMATLYNPMLGIDTLLEHAEKDALSALEAQDDAAVFQANTILMGLKAAHRLMQPMLAIFSPAEAIYLPQDLGTTLAVAVRDGDMYISLVGSAINSYSSAAKNRDIQEMRRALQSLERAPQLGRSIRANIGPFLQACRSELGEMDREDLVSKSAVEIPMFQNVELAGQTPVP